jgi:hypothetical protein
VASGRGCRGRCGGGCAGRRGDLVGGDVSYQGRALAGKDAVKLGQAIADERHLFVWIDFFQKDAVADLRSGGLPGAKPALPPEVDMVWVAEAFCPGRVLTCSLRDGWADSGTWESSADPVTGSQP